MLPLLYHAHHSQHMEDLPFWLELAKEQGGPILELGCGTGRVLAPLAQAGYPVIGLDRDGNMLHFLREHNPDAEVIQADMARFRLVRRFALILMPCNTYSSIPTQTRLAALECIAGHLLPDGLFAASLPNPLQLLDMPARGEPEVEETFLHPLTRNPVLATSSWRRSQRAITMTWQYEHLLPDGTAERCTLQARHALLKLEDYVQEIHAAGLAIKDVYGGFDRSPYHNEADDLILLAGKARILKAERR